jgi:Aspartyl protease
MTTRIRLATHALALALALGAFVTPARAQGDAPAGWREVQPMLREAVRDTIGHGEDPERLSVLGQLLLRLGRFNDADKVLRRVLAKRPGDPATLAGLGKMALYRHHAAEAESLLTAAGDADGAPGDLYAARLRRGDWKGAAELAEATGNLGHVPLLERLESLNAFELLPGPDSVSIGWERIWPAPLLRAKLNGQQVLVVVDPGCPGVLVDPSAMRLHKLESIAGERSVFWLGTRVAARNAIAQKIDLGGMAFANVPVAVTPLHRYSLEVNPQGRDISLVIGLSLLERLGVTIDLKHQRLVLRRSPSAAGVTGQRVPFERWSENQLVVWGTIGGGRRLSMVFGTGLPGGGFGGPTELFEELGIKPGKMSGIIRGANVALQGRSWAQVGVPSLTLGSIVGDRLNGWYGALDGGEVWREGVRLDGVLGPDWLRGRRVTFDWAKHELAFQSN